MGSNNWGSKSPNQDYKYTYLTYNPTYNYPSTPKYQSYPICYYRGDVIALI